MHRRQKAVTAIEMVVGLLVVIPIVLVLIDAIIVTLAVQINDGAAREAVRLAAAGDPSAAQQRATVAVARINQSTAGFTSNIQLASLTFNPANLLATEASMVPNGGLLQGSITVQTTVTVKPVVVQYLSNIPFVFQSSQTCPITYTVPNTAGGQPIAP